MSTENTLAPVQDENVVARRVKQPSLAQSKRPALSNVTNTSTQVTQQVKQQPTRPLKRAASEEEEDAKPQKRHRPEGPQEALDLDADDADDPSMMSEYVTEIYDYLHKLELTTTPKNYFLYRHSLKPRMRSILVDWLVEVHLKFRLIPETLLLAINLMDCFLTEEDIGVDKLQLLATGCLFLAAKYEEVWSPTVKNYAYVTDGASTVEDILGAEKFILKTLNFNLSYPNPMNFLRRISKADNYDINTRTMGKYLLEITVMDYNFLGTRPSLCTAAAMYVARVLLDKPEWDATLVKYSGGYTVEQMKPTVDLIVEYLRAPVVHEEFFKKYASKKFMKVSIIARQKTKMLDQENKPWI